MSSQILEARDAVFLELMKIAKQDRDVILITVDTGAFLFKEFKSTLPNQFFNVGIAEQNAVSVSAGLALAGKKPFLFGISNFVVLRCFEQIKIDVCSMGLPVTIIGMGTGYVYPKDGPTHHMTDVLSLARTLPGMTVWSPSDFAAITGATRLAYASGGPNLIYMDKGPFIPLSDDSTDFTAGVRVVRQGADITLVSHRHHDPPRPCWPPKPWSAKASGPAWWTYTASSPLTRASSGRPWAMPSAS